MKSKKSLRSIISESSFYIVFPISLILTLVLKHSATNLLSFKNPTMTTTRSKTIKTKSKTSKPSSKMSKAKKTVNAMKTNTVKAKKANFKKINTGQVKLKTTQKVTKMTTKKLDDTPDATSEEFDLDVFITQKLGTLNSMNEKKIISDSSKSSLADLVTFNTTLAYSFYKITDENSLETSLLSLQAEEDIKKLDLNPSVAEAWREVAMYRDLLMLGDLPTITQEKRPYEWIYSAPSLSTPAHVALTISIKLTGNKPSSLNMKMPGWEDIWEEE